MKFIPGKDRKQTCLFPISLEDSIEDENSVRSIDQFVDSLDLAELGFRSDFTDRRIFTKLTLPKKMKNLKK